MPPPAVVVDVRKGAMWIRLNRPEAMNSLTPEVLSGIDQALSDAEGNQDVRAVVLTGTGRAFCAGADLKYVRSQSGSDGPRLFLDSVLATMNRLDSFPKPVIAALNGLALAGGLELVLCCDLVLAARGAKIGDAHANYGLLPGGGGSVRLPRVIGPTRAKYLLFTGEFLSADELVEAGLVIDDGRSRLKLEDPRSRWPWMTTPAVPWLTRMKALVDDGLQQPVETALRLELLASEVHSHSADQREGLLAFEEKRAPRFIGQ